MLSSLVTYYDPLLLSSAVPKRSRLQSPPRRASKRWLHSSSLPYMHHVRLAQQNIIGICLTLCLHFEAKNVKIFNCSEGIMWVSKNDCEAKDHIQKPDFLWIISGSSWYSSAETHIWNYKLTKVWEWVLVRTFLKVLRPANIDPPIHVEYFRSGGA